MILNFKFALNITGAAAAMATTAMAVPTNTLSNGSLPLVAAICGIHIRRNPLMPKANPSLSLIGRVAVIRFLPNVR
jgi:hypothetical protein